MSDVTVVIGAGQIRQAISVTGVTHAAGVSPSQAAPEDILRVDLHGTAPVLDEFGGVIAPGGSAGALTAEQDGALAATPADRLLSLPMLQPDEVTDSLHAYQLAEHRNSLRAMAEAVRWGKRSARVSTISPGLIITPLARGELTGPRGEGYRRMLELSPAGAPGQPTRSAPSARSSWAPTKRSSPEATS